MSKYVEKKKIFRLILDNTRMYCFPRQLERKADELEKSTSQTNVDWHQEKQKIDAPVLFDLIA